MQGAMGCATLLASRPDTGNHCVQAEGKVDPLVELVLQDLNSSTLNF